MQTLRSNSVSLSLSEVHQIMLFWDENTPEGLMRKFYHIAAVELAWRGGEAVAYLLDLYNDCSPTNRIKYNPVSVKLVQATQKLHK